jgi:hypothetical protein
MLSTSFWIEFLTFLFFWAGVVAFAIGLLIVISPPLVMRASEVLNRWVSTERVFRDLDSPRPTERLFYRHHRIFGSLLTLGGAYVLYVFGTAELDASKLSSNLMFFGSRTAAQWLLDSLTALNRVFAVLAVALGIAVFFRPSVLKTLESSTNRWFVVDDSLKRLDVRVEGPDRWFARRPRLLGVLIMLASLYIVFNLRVLQG